MNSQFRTAELVKRPTHLYPMIDAYALTSGDSFG